MENEFKAFKAADKSEQALKEAIDSVDEDTADFDVAWEGLSRRYKNLHEFLVD
jgi:hypothetical protein